VSPLSTGSSDNDGRTCNVTASHDSNVPLDTALVSSSPLTNLPPMPSDVDMLVDRLSAQSFSPLPPLPSNDDMLVDRVSVRSLSPLPPLYCDDEMVVDHPALPLSSLNLSSLQGPHLSRSVQGSRKRKIADQDDYIEDDARKRRQGLNGGILGGNGNEEQHSGHDLEDIRSCKDDVEAGDNEHGAATESEGEWGDDESEGDDFEDGDYEQEEDGDDYEDASSDGPYDVEDVLDRRTLVSFLHFSYVTTDVCLTSICLVQNGYVQYLVKWKDYSTPEWVFYGDMKYICPFLYQTTILMTLIIGAAIGSSNAF